MTPKHKHEWQVLIYHVVMQDVMGLQCKVCDEVIKISDVPGYVNELESAAELWKRWFKWSGDPWFNDRTDCDLSCIFCTEGHPNHGHDCVYPEAKELVGTPEEEK